MAKTLATLKQMTDLLWQGRNQALHHQSSNRTRQITTYGDEEITRYYNSPNLLPGDDHHLLTRMPLHELLKRPRTTKVRWFTRARQGRARLLQDGQRQTTINNYFHTTPPFSTDEPAANTAVPHTINQSSQSTRHIPTTQSTMTDFFTGRPPDPRVDKQTTLEIPR
jgi:hypothetical protein